MKEILSGFQCRQPKCERYEYKCHYPKLGKSWHLMDQINCERIATAMAYEETTGAWSARHTIKLFQVHNCPRISPF